MAVLDVGCGTGAITAGIGQRVGRHGRVLGIDRDESLLTIARLQHGAAANLAFENKDVLALDTEAEFDIATAARTLQWIASPERAVAAMARAVKPGGRVVVLDYNHDFNTWHPDPPPAFQRFYRWFLDWRAANGWDNRMADSLAAHFGAAGLHEIEVHPSGEIAHRGDPGFSTAANIWLRVVETIGGAGWEEARDQYRHYIETDLERQHLAMKTAIGVR